MTGTGIPQQVISEPQVNFIRGLVAERDLSSMSNEQVAWLKEAITEGTSAANQLKRISRNKASEMIELMLQLPHKPRATSSGLPDLPAGRYAVDNEDGELRFYILDRPKEGKWAGYTFLSVQASDEKHPIKARAAKEAIMSKIAEDPQAAMNRYGEEIGACGVCGRTLTNQDSRARGIGPICAAKYRDEYGWWN